MKKFVCLVCGYVYEGESAPDECPICHAPASKFAEQAAEKTWAAEHVVGIAKGVDQRIIDGLRENFNGECTEAFHKKLSAYNIFDVLEIQSREVIMCRFLTDLLNPEGMHGCGIRFLKSFIRDVLKMLLRR